MYQSVKTRHGLISHPNINQLLNKIKVQNTNCLFDMHHNTEKNNKKYILIKVIFLTNALANGSMTQLQTMKHIVLAGTLPQPENYTHNSRNDNNNNYTITTHTRYKSQVTYTPELLDKQPMWAFLSKYS